jgi:hypothetical protein
VEGTCQPAVTRAGDACDSAPAGCANNLNLTCEGSKCVENVLATTGLPCGKIDNLARTYCTGAADCFEKEGAGICMAKATDGGACSFDVGPACMAPAICALLAGGGTVGVCTLPNPSLCISVAGDDAIP